MPKQAGIAVNTYLTKLFNPVEDRRQDTVFSKKVRAGNRRTYFFDVRRTRGDDYYLTLTESTKKFNGQGFERHKIFLYKEDFNRFLTNLEEVVAYIKTELMPDYDYEEFDRRHEEWEAQQGEEDNGPDGDEQEGPRPPRAPRPPREEGGDRGPAPRAPSRMTASPTAMRS